MRTGHTFTLLVMVTTIVLRASPAKACSVPLEQQGSALLVPVWIDGEGPFRFLLDSGTSRTVVGTELAGRLKIEAGKAVGAMTADRAIDVHEGRVSELRVGTTVRRNVPILIAPLPQLDQTGIEGVLGLDLFSEASFLIDVRRRCFEPNVDRSNFCGGSSLNASVNGGRIQFKARAARSREEMRFVLDSGASSLVLMSPRARAAARLGDAIDLTTASGRRQAQTGRIDLLIVGTIRFPDVDAILLPDSMGREEDGLFPLRLFSNVLVDAGTGTVTVNVGHR